MDVLYIRAGGQGWGPIDQLAHLAARLLEGHLFTVDDRGDVHTIRKVSSHLPRVRLGARRLLVIASNPAHLAYAARLQHWLPGYDLVTAWIIDSFWTDRISRFARVGRHFDHLFITDRDLVAEWGDLTRTSVSWLPWGTDTEAFSITDEDRPTDLLRLGRQPMAWDDDAVTLAEGDQLGLTVEGRPPMQVDNLRNQQVVRDALLRSKTVLTFSNRVSPAPYTHPTREYLTGRWMDALAAGCLVVGVAPASASYTLWRGATAEINPEDRRAGLMQVKELVSGWTVNDALQQHLRARETIDWRYRLAQLGDELDIQHTETLKRELVSLKGNA